VPESSLSQPRTYVWATVARSVNAVFTSYWRHRQLILQLARRDVMGRYRGSLLGLAWSFLTPLLMLLVYTFLFGVVFKSRWGGATVESRLDFALILFVGLIVHGLFAECVNRAPGLVLQHASFVKRVVALPGETVSIADKRVRVDGRELIEPYAFHSDDNTWSNDPSTSEEHRRRDQLPPTRVPDGAYFLLGDNRDDSSDSRSWGTVPAGHILGRALLVYWSAPPPPSGGGKGVLAPLGALSRTRWDRVFALVR